MDRDFKGVWIPKDLWLDKSLSLQEKAFVVEISSLDNENGCFASNAYFADFFGISKDRASKIINGLVGKGIITSEVVDNQRILHTPSYFQLPPSAETPTPLGGNADHNNIYNNII
jgi:hypothetical protein